MSDNSLFGFVSQDRTKRGSLSTMLALGGRHRRMAHIENGIQVAVYVSPNTIVVV